MLNGGGFDVKTRKEMCGEEVTKKKMTDTKKGNGEEEKRRDTLSKAPQL
jgi:hypothetical protein